MTAEYQQGLATELVICFACRRVPVDTISPRSVAIIKREHVLRRKNVKRLLCDRCREH